MIIQKKDVSSHCYMTRITSFSLEEHEVLEYGESSFNCLIVISKGSLKCSYIEAAVLNKGESILLTCDHSFRLKSGEKQVLGYIVEFQLSNGTNAAQLNNEISAVHGKSLRIKPFHQLNMKLKHVYEHIDTSSAKVQLANQMMFLEMFRTFLDVFSTNCEIGDARSYVQQSIELIHQRYMNKFTVEQLAQNANVGVRQYLRIFKTITGTTPIAYINQYRIYRAQELLLLNDACVQNIASEVGFDDVNYFNRIFKKKVGCAPKEYIRLKQRNPRIATLHYTGECLALGIVPIADLTTTLMQLYALPEGIQHIGEITCNIEKLKDLKPDIVILSDSIEPEIKEQIEKFVPIIVIPWDVDPTTRLQQIAGVMGKAEEAKSYISTYEQERKEKKAWCARQRFRRQSATIVRLDEGKVWIHAARFFPVFYEVMSFQPSKLMLKTTESQHGFRRYEVSLEQLSQLESDRIYIVLGYEADFMKWLDVLVESDEWNVLQAVKQDEVYMLRQQGIANSIYNQKSQLAECSTIMSGEVPPNYEGLLIGKLSSFLAETCQGCQKKL